jgi:hypothetical protein
MGRVHGCIANDSADPTQCRWYVLDSGSLPRTARTEL